MSTQRTPLNDSGSQSQRKSSKYQLSAGHYPVTLSEAGISPSIPTTMTLQGSAAWDSPEPQIRTTQTHSLGVQLAVSLPYCCAGVWATVTGA